MDDNLKPAPEPIHINDRTMVCFKLPSGEVIEVNIRNDKLRVSCDKRIVVIAHASNVIYVDSVD